MSVLAGGAVTRVLVAAWVGSTNLGDELVFAGLAAKLRAWGVDVEVVSVDPAGTRRDHPGVEPVPAGDPWAVGAAVRRADAVVLGGGGLLQDSTSPLNLPYHLSRVAAARALRTPYAGVGLGAGRLDTRLGRRLVRAGLSGARAVSVRDGDSARLLAALGLRDVTVAADLALGLPLPRVPAGDRVVVALRPWNGGRSLLPASVRARRADTPEHWLRRTAAALDEVAARTGLAVHFVALQTDRDAILHEQLAERMTTPVTAAAPATADVVAEVATGRVVVAMRYHAGIAAVLAGRPAVLVGYSPKVDALAGELGRGGSGLGWDAGGLSGLAERVSAVAPYDDEVAQARERLRQRERGNDLALDALLSG